MSTASGEGNEFFPFYQEQLCRRFSLAEIKLVTRNFDEGLVIGQGGFGKVYKGVITNAGASIVAAVKRLDSGSRQGATEFWAEIELLSTLRHFHLVSLVGYCNDGDEMILIYEYMSRGTLEEHLHKVGTGTPLSWVRRLNICIGAARGLHYLHTSNGSQHGVIHRDVKSSNILLDEDWAAKISDFGLCKMPPGNQTCTYVHTAVKGTFGYLDPAYFSTGKLTRKSDVFAFGVVLFEVLCGRRAVDTSLPEDQWGLVGWVQDCAKKRKLDQIIDSRLSGQIAPKCLKVFTQIAHRCLHNRPKERPPMAEVVVSLEIAMALQERADNPVQPANISTFTRKVQKLIFATVGMNSDDATPTRKSEDDNDSRPPNRGKEVENVLEPKYQNDGSVGHRGERRQSKPNPRLSNLPKNVYGEQVAAGWPSWLCNVAGEAINGWIPINCDTFDKLAKIGQGTYSNVYKAKDRRTGKIVALKKVRFDSSEPSSVRFMAEEILILRHLDHPNVIKLEGIAMTRMQFSLYLVLEYMEHDLSGLLVKHTIKFTEPQVKCCIRQLLSGLEHCHNRHVLHRDIKVSDLLIDGQGVLKIADFGLASYYDSMHKQPNTGPVGTLWYRSPELLLGTSDFGVGGDLWSVGCILAELLAGKPVMPGHSEADQLSRIFKLCGSPSEKYWKNRKLQKVPMYKPQRLHKRCIAETFKKFPPSSLPLIETLFAIDPAERQTAAAALRSKFFTTEPYACHPTCLTQNLSWEEPEEQQYHVAWRGRRKTRARMLSVGAIPAPDANSILEIDSHHCRGRRKTHARNCSEGAIPAPEANSISEATLDQLQLSEKWVKQAEMSARKWLSE